MKCGLFSEILVLGAVFTLLVGCGGNQADNESVAVPVVSGISPATFPSSTLSRTVTVSGADFEAGLEVTLTTSSGTTEPTPFEVTSTSFQITAVFPAGTCTITVANPGGASSFPFNFVAKTATGISFAPRVDYPTGGTITGVGAGSASIAFADFNGDGKLDIAVSNYGSNTISIFLNKGDGSFGSPVMTTIGPPSNPGLAGIVAADFNEDGKTDLIVSGSQGDIVLLGNGDGTFAQASAISGGGEFYHALATDLNGDKHLDLVAAGNSYLMVALGAGNGTFSPATTLPAAEVMPPPPQYPQGVAASPWEIDIGDLTGSGKSDIVGGIFYPNAAAGVAVYEGNGDGSFQVPTWQSTAPYIPDSVALADFNGDGKLDVLLGYTISAEVALGNGTGSFNVVSQIPVYQGGQFTFVRAADLDQDGKPDALVADDGAGVLTVVLNNGSGVLDGSTYSYTIAPGICDLAVGDLNGDGMPDVVLVNNLTNQVSVFLSQDQ